MSDNHSEYMGFKRMLESKWIKLSFFNDVLFDFAKAKLQNDQINNRLNGVDEPTYLVVIDGSEIRKPHFSRSSKHSNVAGLLQGVRSLNGEIVNGFRSTGMILLSEDNSEAMLLQQDLFSSKEEKYISDKSYDLNLIKKASKLKCKKVFVLDRLYDNLETMTTLNDKNDEFVVRVKHKNRKVNYLSKPIKTNLPLSAEVKSRLATPQVLQADMGAFPIECTKEFREKIDRIKLKKGTFFDVTAVYRSKEVIIEPNPLHAQDESESNEISTDSKRSPKQSKNIAGTVIEITLKQRGAKGSNSVNMFKESMMIFTNKINLTQQEVKNTYYRYVKRFGIEEVYKFLKNTLGLEEFQIQDFESIKKLVATTFFAGAYLYMNDQAKLDNPIFIKQIQSICYLGCGKGTVSKFYLRQGLQSFRESEKVRIWREKNNISDEEYDRICKYYGLRI